MANVNDQVQFQRSDGSIQIGTLEYMVADKYIVSWIENGVQLGKEVRYLRIYEHTLLN